MAIRFSSASNFSEIARAVKAGLMRKMVPKPYTPFQWAAQPTAEYFEEARRILARTAGRKRSAVTIKSHSPQRSILEGVFARGDRRLAPAIEAAYRLGACMDGWDEAFDYTI